jgi:hypothetical protein
MAWYVTNQEQGHIHQFTQAGWSDRQGGGTLHNEELHNLYPSLNTIGVKKSRSVRWTGHVERVGIQSYNTKHMEHNMGGPSHRW